MALALNPQPQTRQNVRPARHLYLVPELDPTPVGAYRPASRPVVRPAARRSAQHPSMANTTSVATYQRRRLVVMVAVMLVLGVVIAGVIGATGTTAQADQAVAGQAIAPRTVIAQPGDTLWAIARRVAPQGNISELVDQLVRINGDAIVAGQLVRIP
ncbi:MAG: LysM peptidoglycan-binding domain-containing protein [Acidimicrobiia bacterium]|jgi:nucleoid-associated protein YgaU